MFKRVVRVMAIIGVVIAIVIFVTSTALAAPGLVTNLVANPSNTSMILTWTIASSSTSTVIRYATDDFPATPASGTSAYSGTGFQCTIESLTAGQVYYIAAWGYDGADYSASACELAMSTTSIDVPSGAADESSITLPSPTLPANINQTPDASGMNLEPFTSIITYFNTADGGFGMPVNNAWQWFVVLGIVGAGMGTYIKIKQFFVAFAVVFVLTCIAVGLDLVQGWLVAVEVIMGAGVWAIEKYLQ